MRYNQILSLFFMFDSGLPRKPLFLLILGQERKKNLYAIDTFNIVKQHIPLVQPLLSHDLNLAA